MSIDKEFLEILRCPATGKEVRLLSAGELERVNEAIATGDAKHADKTPVDDPLDEAVVTVDGETAYRIDGGIPVMLKEKGIPLGGIL